MVGSTVLWLILTISLSLAFPVLLILPIFALFAVFSLSFLLFLLFKIVDSFEANT